MQHHDAEVSQEAELEPEPSEAERRATTLNRAAEEAEQFLAEFTSQSVDSAWARTWEENLDRRISGNLASREGFAYADVECRKDRCVATVNWADFASAESNFMETITLTHGDCATSSFMAPPEDESRAYSHKIRFSHCRSAR